MASRDVIVLGAGVAGLSVALPLRRRGFGVTVIDPLPPPGGASFGNAGLICAHTVVPIALPGMLRRVPAWLMDPLGPLSVRPMYLPQAAPWLLRWIRAGRLSNVVAISDSMSKLHAPTLTCWRSLLGSAYDSLIRVAGYVQLWDERDETPTAAVERHLRERHGIEARELKLEEVLHLLPGLAPSAIGRALFVPGNGQTVNPGRLVRRLSEVFVQEGGRILAERALKLIAEPEGAGWTVMTNCDNHQTSTVVVAAGAWSTSLIEPLGIRVPLETERGYHAMLPAPNVSLAVPLLHKSRGFGITPMEEGLRIAGTIEISGRDTPPNEQRARILVEHAKALFPSLQSGTPRLWMGGRPSTPDSLPVVGPAPGFKNLFLCFGHGHFGMTGAPPSGQLLAEIISGETPFVAPEILSVSRFDRRRRGVGSSAQQETSAGIRH